MPMKFYISSEFGAVEAIRDGRPHTGLDIPLEMGTPLRSVIDGTVERITSGGNLGNGVIIRGEDGNAYIYGHLSRVQVHKGEHIEAGKDILGLSGTSGHSTGPHLHFGIQQPDGTFVDPTPAVKALEQVTGATTDPGGLWHFLTTPPNTDGIPKMQNPGDAVGGFMEDAITRWFMNRLHDLGVWLNDYGLFIGAEFAFIISLVFFLFAISGKGPWMERGVKWFVGSILLGVAAHAL